MRLTSSTARRLATLAASGLFLLSAMQCNAQIFHKKKRVNKATTADNSAEPDKILYDKAMDAIKHGRHEVGRLSLQTLINTYPDSEYLADAKLAIADSYYKEGGTANTTQAIQAYEDFYVFFPMLQKAAYAKLQVAMAHYRQMEKPDRDRSEARAAEDAFQTFLQKYPNDPLAPKAEQRLREVQEVLAEGDFRIGYFYYTTKGDKRAAASRLMMVVNRYPLYSKADQALWMLGNIWEGTEKKEFAAPYYAKIVRDYPLSSLAPQAKERLKALKAPVPQPDPKAVAWMTAEQNAPRKHESLVKKPLALVRSAPHAEMIASAKTGAPNLEPESDNTSATDILSGGNKSTIGGSGGAAGSSAVVETVTPGTSGSASGEAAQPAAEGGATNGSTPNENNGAAAPAANSPDPGSATPAGSAPANPPAANSPVSDANAPNPNGSGSAAPASTNGDGGNPPANGSASGSSDSANGDSAKGDDSQSSSNSKNDPKKESSSKKKKGMRKVLPW